jgi:hypothetical protein
VKGVERGAAVADLKTVLSLCTILGAGVLALPSCAPSGARAQRYSTTWADQSPHRVQFVSVAPGVRLEVLDWGGAGPPLVFLSGL